MDFPSARFHLPVISSLSPEALGPHKQALTATVPASSAWPAANRAIFVPFTLAAPYLLKTVWWANGATAAGNVDCGVYSQGGALLSSAGSTAQGTINVVQSVTVTAMLLTPGSYYMALVASSGSATFFRASPTAVQLIMSGAAQQATALPLPASFTLATVASAYLPLFGIGHPVVI